MSTAAYDLGMNAWLAACRSLLRGRGAAPCRGRRGPGRTSVVALLLLVVLGAKRFLVDVTVPRATAPSTLADPAMATAGACTAAEAFLLDALVRLSVALQRGNALVLQRGMQQLRMEQSALLTGPWSIEECEADGLAPVPVQLN